MAGGLFAAADVHYPRGGGARAALVLASDAAFSVLVSSKVVVVEHVAAAYRPGEFYLRELPPLRAVMSGVSGVSMLVVDGYVTLDPGGRRGLGAYAHEEFGVPVIGVAKTAFAPATHAIPVLRGSATRPLYVTSAGLPPADAASLVAAMSGVFRLPDALRRVDALARGRRSGARLTLDLVSSTASDAMAAKAGNALTLYRPVTENVEIRLHQSCCTAQSTALMTSLFVNHHAYGIPAARAPTFCFRQCDDGDMVGSYVDSFESLEHGEITPLNLLPNSSAVTHIEAIAARRNADQEQTRCHLWTTTYRVLASYIHHADKHYAIRTPLRGNRVGQPSL